MKPLIKKYTYSFVFIFFFLFWFSIFIGSGSVFSGYHYADDHQIFEIYKDLVSTQNNIIEVTSKWIIDDTFRFKPLYYFYRVVETSIWGDNFNIRLIFNGLLAVCTSFFLFLFFKKIGFSILESVLFPLLSLVGVQAIIWWSAAINEAFSMVLLSLSLMFMAYGIYSEKGRFAYQLLFIIFSVLMSLSKENFILLIPVLLFWNVWLYQQKNYVSFFASSKRNIFAVVTLSIIMFAELFIIVNWIGTNPYGPGKGAGFDKFSPLPYLILFKNTTLSISTVGMGLISLVGILLIIISGGLSSLSFRLKCLLRYLLYPVIIALLIIGPQIIIHSRVGFPFGRYILPLILGYSIFYIHIIRFLRENNSGYLIGLPSRDLKWVYLLLIAAGLSLIFGGFLFLYNKEVRFLLFAGLGRPVPMEVIDILKPGILGVVAGIFIIFCGWVIARKEKMYKILNIMVFLAVITIFYKTVLAFTGAYEYALEGKRYKWLFQSIQNNTKPDDEILIVADRVRYVEPGAVTKVYLNNAAKRTRIYIHWMSEDQPIYIENARKINHVITFRELEQRFLKTSKDWFNSSDFKRDANDFFMVYYKNIP